MVTVFPIQSLNKKQAQKRSLSGLGEVAFLLGQASTAPTDTHLGSLPKSQVLIWEPPQSHLCFALLIPCSTAIPHLDHEQFVSISHNIQYENT